MGWGSDEKNQRNKTVENGGTKINRTRLPTAPLGVEITTGVWACAGLDRGVFLGFSRLRGRWEEVPKKYQKRPDEVGQK